MNDAKQFRILIGERLKKGRELRNLSIDDVADKLDISVSYLQSLEKGEEDFSLDLLYSLCKVLGIDITQLFQ